jgi:hypothetical protein
MEIQCASFPSNILKCFHRKQRTSPSMKPISCSIFLIKGKRLRCVPLLSAKNKMKIHRFSLIFPLIQYNPSMGVLSIIFTVVFQNFCWQGLAGMNVSLDKSKNPKEIAKNSCSKIGLTRLKPDKSLQFPAEVVLETGIPKQCYSTLNRATSFIKVLIPSWFFPLMSLT